MELIAAELVPPVQLAPQEGAVADVHAPEESKADEEERPGIESLGENEVRAEERRLDDFCGLMLASSLPTAISSCCDS